MPSGERSQGTAGAEVFYESCILSFDGMQWVPQALAIGPQGVLDVVGQPVHLQWVIAFPWLPAEGKFRGEKIYSIRQLTGAEGS